MRTNSLIYILVLVTLLPFACNSRKASDAAHGPASEGGKGEAEVLIKRRDDGTISSVNPLDSMGFVHGVRVSYYPDGKTVYAQITIVHGIKEGPYARYYRNGRVFEQYGYSEGKKHGPARRYYKSGRLLADYAYDEGRKLPGLKEYDEAGNLLTDYPDIRFREEEQLQARSLIDLVVYSDPVRKGIKYYVEQEEGETGNPVYLIAENGAASLRFYVRPGETLVRQVKVIAEIPTALGNTMVRHASYTLRVVRPGESS